MKTIIVPVDFSDATAPVVTAATSLALALSATMVLVHVIAPVVDARLTIDRFALTRATTASEQLEEWYEKLKSDGFSSEPVQVAGDPAACICEEAERRQADYIVMGSHGHGALHDLLLGSTARSVIKKSACPVLIVPVPSLGIMLSDSGREPGAPPEDPYVPPPGN